MKIYKKKELPNLWEKSLIMKKGAKLYFNKNQTNFQL